jgi:hypothetical protein
MDGVSPPAIHINLRMFDVSKLPIGNLSTSNPAVIPGAFQDKGIIEVDIPEAEKTSFDVWLRQLWYDKDHLISRFLEIDSFSDSSAGAKPIEIPLKLRRKRDVLDAFCFFLPALAGYLAKAVKP